MASAEKGSSLPENGASPEKSDYVSLKREYDSLKSNHESLKTNHESLKRDYQQAMLKVEVLEVFPKVVSAARNVLRSLSESSRPLSSSGSVSPVPDVPVEWITTEKPTSYEENWDQAALNVVTTNPSRFVGDILVAVFGKSYLATHSLSGSKSSHPSVKGKEPKPALPINTIPCVRYAMKKRLGITIADEKIKSLVRFKLNNCNRTLFKPEVMTEATTGSSLMTLDVDSDAEADLV